MRRKDLISNSEQTLSQGLQTTPLEYDRWDSERLYIDGDAYFRDLELAIDVAQKSILFETYIVDEDALSREVVKCLVNAAHRGVEVRILVDGLGAGAWALRHGKDLQIQGIEIRVYHPLPWLLFPHFIRSVFHARSFFRFLFLINRRDHRKVCVVDFKKAFVGSMNLTAWHSRKLKGVKAWRDTGVAVEGRQVSLLSVAFENAWRRSWKMGVHTFRPPMLWRKQNVFEGSSSVRLNHTRVLRWRGYAELLQRLKTAHKTIWLTNAYFVPHGSIMRALSQAARAGVDVRLIVPQHADVPFMPWVSAAFYHALIQKGVQIYEYMPGMIHAKTMLIDDWCTVGSSNFNHRSLLHDLEADVVLQHYTSKFRLREAFLTDLGMSVRITNESFYNRPRWQRFLGKLVLAMKYWL